MERNRLLSIGLFLKSTRYPSTSDDASQSDSESEKKNAISCSSRRTMQHSNTKFFVKSCDDESLYLQPGKSEGWQNHRRRKFIQVVHICAHVWNEGNTLRVRFFKKIQDWILKSERIWKYRRVGGGVRGVRTNPLWWSIMEHWKHKPLVFSFKQIVEE